jgi:hypothetical protein
MRRNPVGNGIGGHLGLVHVHEDDALAVRRPEIIAANREFLGVHPVDVAVEKIVARIVGELPLLVAADRAHKEIVLADIGHAVTVRRKLRIAARISRGRKLHCRIVAQVIHPQLSLRIKEEMLGVRSPQVGGHVIPGEALLLALVLDFVHIRGE